MIVVYLLLGVVGASLVLSLGYWLGLRRFQHQLDGAVSSAQELARAEAEREAAPDTVTHTVILDGITASGKTTFVARLAFPCVGRQALANLPATPRQYLTHPLPLCFEWPAPALPAGDADGGEVAVPVAEPLDGIPPEKIHALRFYDVSGERPSTVVNAVNSLARDRNRTGNVTALWVWDMADGPTNRSHLNFGRIDACYGSDEARKLIKQVVVFFNKLDQLAVEPDQLDDLIEAERTYIRSMAEKVFDKGVHVSFHQGTALDGQGVFDTYGTLIQALGLEHHFPLMDAVEPGAGPGRS